MSRLKSIENFIGQKFGRWTILNDMGTVNKQRFVMVSCDCGVTKAVGFYTITSGQSKSCGCLHKEIVAEKLKERATTHGLSNHLLYGIWCNIKRRCRVEGSEVYHLYGAVGVEICDEWFNDFKPFYDWCMQNGWKQGLEVDKDLKSETKPGKMYSPEFCSIVTPAVNGRNKSTTKFITHNGETLSVQDWADKLKLDYKLVWGRLRKGWTIERMINDPGLVEHSHFITYKGETLRITEWAARINIGVNSLIKRLKKGWGLQKALETPVDLRFVRNKNKAA